MNKLTIIGRLTKEPESRTTQNGVQICTFNVAVNRRKSGAEHPEADFFRVTAWRQLADNCKRYLAKGRQVCVIGSVSVSIYTANDGKARANMEVTADEVEFLSGRNEAQEEPKAQEQQKAQTFVETDEDDLPF